MRNKILNGFIFLCRIYTIMFVGFINALAFYYWFTGTWTVLVFFITVPLAIGATFKRR